MDPLADTPAEQFVQFYGRAAWQDWQRLLAHFELGEGFAFLVLLLPGAVGAEICHRNLQAFLASQGKRLAEVSGEWPDDVRRLPERLLVVPPASDLGGLWIGTVIPESDPEIQRWQQAWRTGLAALNEQRNPLKARFACPLVLVGAPWLQLLLRESAPDLWSIRTGVVSVTPAPEPPTERAGGIIDVEARSQVTGEAAVDPDYTLEQAERLRGKPNLEVDRARLLLRAGAGFYGRNRSDSAENCFREAAAIFSTTAKDNRNLQSNWAGALNSLAVVLSDLGQREEALTKAEEAERISSQLARARPDSFLPDLAGTLNNLANRLGALGRREDALAKAEEAERIYAQLAEGQPDAFLPDLAMSLNNLANRLSDLGRREDALAKAEKAVRIYAQLAKARPDAFLPNLAASMNNLAAILSDLGRREEALAKAEESVRIYAQLARARSDAFLPNLALSLNTQANILSDLGRPEEAVAKVQEALRIYEQLAQIRPDVFLPDLARSLAVEGKCLFKLKRHSEAAEVLGKSIQTILPPFRALPAAFASLIKAMVSRYLQAAAAAGVEPDAVLLAPVTEILEQLKQEQAESQKTKDPAEQT
jgi:tetratricopeptide (TPR) repeat protein